MTRTSHSHPLQIAAVSAGGDLGRIGITFCPGKKQSSAMSGAWARDLDLDLDAVEAWGAAAVLTLLEDHKLESLQVTRLGETVRARHMVWLHAPIPDVSVPDAAFERTWLEHGERARTLLRSGFDLVVHCKGGLGRAGMIAARLLAELGWKQEHAVSAIRSVRPGAIETGAQLQHVLSTRYKPEPRPDLSPAAEKDRAVGCLLGLALGDALGTTLEFRVRDTYTPLSRLEGGGPFKLKRGEWTDDTAMALALADSLIAHADLDEEDLLNRFTAWWRDGTYSCTGRCFDIGVTTRQALQRWL